jgi:hypothetical protein
MELPPKAARRGIFSSELVACTREARGLGTEWVLFLELGGAYIND